MYKNITRKVSLVLILLIASSAISQVIPYRKGTHWGLSDAKKNLLLPIEYDSIAIIPNYSKYGYLYKNKKVGLYDKRGTICIQVVFDSIRIVNDSVFVCRLRGHKGIYNHKGIKLPLPEFDEIQDLGYTIYEYKRNNKIGLVKISNGKIVKNISPAYESLEFAGYIEDFPVYQLRKKETNYYVSNYLKFVSFSNSKEEDIAKEEVNAPQKEQTIAKAETAKICTCDSLLLKSMAIGDSLTCLYENELVNIKKTKGRWGVQDSRSNTILPSIYEEVLPASKLFNFYNGNYFSDKYLFFAKYNSKWGIVEKVMGNAQTKDSLFVLVNFNYDSIEIRNTLNCLVKDSLEGFCFRRSGNVVLIEPTYLCIFPEAYLADDGLLYKVLSVNQRYGFISSQGVEYFEE